MVGLTVRPAGADDLDALLQIAARRREQYAHHQPQFWRPAADAVERQRLFFADLLEDPEVAVLVASVAGGVAGFVIARVIDAPPVYDPGGRTCLVDDFTVADDADWPELGPALLDAVRGWAADQGAVQVVVVTAAVDDVKRTVLRDRELSPASEWWVAPI